MQATKCPGVGRDPWEKEGEGTETALQTGSKHRTGPEVTSKTSKDGKKGEREEKGRIRKQQNGKKRKEKEGKDWKKNLNPCPGTFGVKYSGEGSRSTGRKCNTVEGERHGKGGFVPTQHQQ